MLKIWLQPLIMVIRNIERHSTQYHVIRTPSGAFRFLLFYQTSKSDNRDENTDRCIDKTLETIDSKFGCYRFYTIIFNIFFSLLLIQKSF